MGTSPGHSQKQTGKKLDSFEMWCCRRLLRVLWTDKMTNQWVLDKIGTSPILQKSMILRKMLFLGHIEKGSMERYIIEGKVEGKRKTTDIMGK